jgi:putative ABC transport system permease protein
MIRHILTTFYRAALQSRFQLIAIVFGLTIGMVVSLLIFIYVTEESQYDSHHADNSRIFRVNTTLEMEGKVDYTAKAGYNTGEALMDFYPEIESFTQILNIGKQTIKVELDLYASEAVIYADSNYFTFFSYPFVEGTPEDALLGPNKVVVSSATARQYFGSPSNAINKTINVNNVDFQITGVYDETEIRTHIPYSTFLSLSTLPKDFLQQRNREYMWITTYNYVKLKPGVSQADLQNKLKMFHEKHLKPYVERNQVNGAITFDLEPVTHIHLNNKLRFDMPGAIDPNYLKIFSAVAVLTLFIALINYINLTTAHVSKRLKEIGIKKSVGAGKSLLFVQFLSETLIVVCVSYILALGLLSLSLAQLNELTDRNFTIAQIVTPQFLGYSLLFILTFGLLAGIYPAILLSSFKPIQALQSTRKPLGTSLFQRVVTPGFIRKILVTVQFGISSFLIIGTIIIFNQFNFMQRQNLGFTRDQVMVIDIPNDTAVSRKIDVFKDKVRQIGAVQSVSAASTIPGTGHGALTMNVSQSGGSEIKVINTFFTDEKYMETLGLELASGRFFSKEFSTDPQQAFVINEAAAKFLGWEDPLNKKLVSPLGQDGTVVGVLKDFNYKSLHSVIEPLIIMNTPTSQGYLLVRLATSDVHSSVDQISTIWKEFDSAHPYEYFFLDEKFQAQYVKEARLTTMFTWFSALAILISCIGLIGLAMFTNELKTKEIAIRKTLGANNGQILVLLSKNFLILIFLANVIAWPMSYFGISDWLSAFAYKMPMDAFPFVLALLITFGIAICTISYFAYKAARQAIVPALKIE